MPFKLDIIDYAFEFRDPTWADEIDCTNYLEVMSKVLVRVSKGGKSLDLRPEEAYRVLLKFSSELREKIWVMYNVHKRKDATFSLHAPPWTAPEPSVVETQELPEEAHDGAN
jgi:hypothetical protein